MPTTLKKQALMSQSKNKAGNQVIEVDPYIKADPMDL
jgi:hypothetical protein